MVILETLVAAVALGIAAQVVAERFHLPAILPLLVLGILCGPSGLGLFAPASLGDVLEVFIHLGVAIILFEGGLTLDPQRLLKVGAPVRNLLTIGAAVTAAGAAWLAHAALALPWPTAVLFGAIMTVTGPTVIVPLLRHMIAPRPVKTVLLSEGLIIDPIGAVAAYLVLQWIEQPGTPPMEIGGAILHLAAVGTVLGFVAGALAKLIVRSRVVGGELTNLAILALLTVCYLVSEQQAHQSGILAAMVMGFTMSAAELPDLSPLKAFKGQLTTLVISSLFILLAGQLRIGPVVALGWPSLVVVVGLVFLVRPASVLLSVWPSHLPWRDRVVLAMTAPRGIVAAAVASLAARQMNQLGIPGGTAVEGLVYVTILATGAWATVMAIFLPWVLGYTRDPSRRRAVIVGANPVTERLARLLRASGRDTVVIDAVSWRLDRFRKASVGVVCGDARDASTYEEAGVERDSTVIAATTNDELNLLVAELVRDEFGVEHPVVVQQHPPEELGRRSRAWVDLLGARGVEIPWWIRQIENEHVRLVEVDPGDQAAMGTLREAEREVGRRILRLATRSAGDIGLGVDDEHVAGVDRLLLLVADGRAHELLRPVDVSDRDEGAHTETAPAAEPVEPA